MTVPFVHELFIVRHGETEWNAAGRLQGGQDSPLTAQGEAQARQVGQILARAGVTGQSHAFRTSPQGRSRLTAKLALGPEGGDIGVTATPLDELAEITMGDWSGLDRTEIDSRWPGPHDEDMLSFYDRAPRGEGLAALFARACRVLEGIEGPSVLFTHGMTSRALRARALGKGIGVMGDLPGGQGVVFHVLNGEHRMLRS